MKPRETFVSRARWNRAKSKGTFEVLPCRRRLGGEPLGHQPVGGQPGLPPAHPGHATGLVSGAAPGTSAARSGAAAALIPPPPQALQNDSANFRIQTSDAIYICFACGESLHCVLGNGPWIIPASGISAAGAARECQQRRRVYLVTKIPCQYTCTSFNAQRICAAPGSRHSRPAHTPPPPPGRRRHFQTGSRARLVLLEVVRHGGYVPVHDDDSAKPVGDSDRAPSLACRPSRGPREPSAG